MATTKRYLQLHARLGFGEKHTGMPWQAGQQREKFIRALGNFSSRGLRGLGSSQFWKHSWWWKGRLGYLFWTRCYVVEHNRKNVPLVLCWALSSMSLLSGMWEPAGNQSPVKTDHFLSMWPLQLSDRGFLQNKRINNRQKDDWTHYPISWGSQAPSTPSTRTAFHGDSGRTCNTHPAQKPGCRCK